MHKHRNFIFVVLDLMIPHIDGWEVCRQMRRDSDVPILMLTAREDEIDRITGLTLGADDYVIKPFSPRELVARVKAILRRGRLPAYQEKQVLSHHGLVFDIEKRQVTIDDRSVTLTPHEYKLLQALFGRPGKVFTRSELLERLYPWLDLPRGQAPAFVRNFYGQGLDQPELAWFSHLPRWDTTARAKLFYSDAVASQLREQAMDTLAASLPPGISRWDGFNRAQYLEAKSLMAGYLLCSQGDRMLMANSVEGRFPFLDHRVTIPEF